MSLDAELILLGENKNKKIIDDVFFYLFLLLAKFFVYKCKVTESLPNIKHLK